MQHSLALPVRSWLPRVPLAAAILLSLLACLWVPATVLAQTGFITKVAGTAKDPDYSGDGGPATLAQLSVPAGVAVDAAGNLFIADHRNHVIRRVDATTKEITRFAGDGSAAYGGDGGPATDAKLLNPYGLAFDAAGNLYIADSSNHVIRMVDAAGEINTFAGIPTEDGYDPAQDNGPATEAELNQPRGVAVDGAGNLYIADSSNHVIRMVDAEAPHNITTVAGTGGVAGYDGDGGAATSAKLDYPTGVAVDAAGNLYIADHYNHVIRKVDASTKEITTVAGGNVGVFGGDGGPATEAYLNEPTHVAVDGAGNLFIADSENYVIRRVDAAEPHDITTVAGKEGGGVYESAQDGRPATEAELDYPEGLAFDAAGNLYIADTSNHVIRRVEAAGVPFGPTISDPPTADAGGPYGTVEGQGVTLDGTGSSDDVKVVLYEWDLDNDGSYDDATGATVALLKGDDGVFTVGLRVTDGDGSTDTDSTTVTVGNVAPSVSGGGPIMVALGSAAVVQFRYTDPGTDTHTALLEWGDGALQSVAVDAAARTVRGTHTYGGVGTYRVGVKVTDDDGGEGTGHAVVTVYAPAGVVCGETVSGSVTMTGNLDCGAAADRVRGAAPAYAVKVVEGGRLQMAGYTIRGSGSGIGVLVEDAGSTEVANGTIRGFGTGVVVTGAATKRAMLTDLTVRDNAGPGIEVTEGAGVVVRRTELIDNNATPLPGGQFGQISLLMPAGKVQIRCSRIAWEELLGGGPVDPLAAGEAGYGGIGIREGRGGAEGPDMKVTLRGNLIEGNPVGLLVDKDDKRGDAGLKVVGRNNSFAGNTVAAGLRTDAGSKSTLDLRRNWWNDPSGPGGEGPGSGDPVFNVGNPRSTLLLGNHLQKAKHCWK